MKAQIESTTKIVALVINGVEVPARVWEGTSEQGVDCHFYVTRVAVARDLDASQFEQELFEQRVPTAEIAALPARMILV